MSHKHFCLIAALSAVLLFSACLPRPDVPEPDEPDDPDKELVTQGTISGWPGALGIIGEGLYNIANVEFIYDDVTGQVVDTIELYALNVGFAEVTGLDKDLRSFGFIIYRYNALLDEGEYSGDYFIGPDIEIDFEDVINGATPFWGSALARDEFDNQYFSDSTSVLNLTKISMGDSTISGTFDFRLENENDPSDVMEISGTFEDIELTVNFY